MKTSCIVPGVIPNEVRDVLFQMYEPTHWFVSSPLSFNIKRDAPSVKCQKAPLKRFKKNLRTHDETSRELL